MSETPRPPPPGEATPPLGGDDAPFAELRPLAPLPRRREARPQRRGARWAGQAWDALSVSLPVLLLGVLAGLSWWLVRSTPPPPEPKAAVSVAHLPDYTLDRFQLLGHAADGRLLHRLEGEALRHYPDRDVHEIDAVRLQSYDEGAGVVKAQADQGLVEQAAGRITLRGRVQAEQRAGAPGGDGPLRVLGERVEIEPRARRLSSPEPLRLVQDGLEVQAGRLVYDHARRVAELLDGVRGRLEPAGADATPPVSAPTPAPRPAAARAATPRARAAKPAAARPPR